MDQNIYIDFKIKTHLFVKEIYIVTEKFPKSELFGSVSQLRRAAVSIMLNFLEGYARFKPKVKLNFFETSYGSDKECKYLIYFAKEMGWIEISAYERLFNLLDNIGAMLWKIIEGLSNQIENSENGK